MTPEISQSTAATWLTPPLDWEGPALGVPGAAAWAVAGQTPFVPERAQLQPVDLRHAVRALKEALVPFTRAGLRELVPAHAATPLLEGSNRTLVDLVAEVVAHRVTDEALVAGGRRGGAVLLQP